MSSNFGSIADLFATLGLDTAEFEAGLSTVQKDILDTAGVMDVQVAKIKTSLISLATGIEANSAAMLAQGDVIKTIMEQQDVGSQERAARIALAGIQSMEEQAQQQKELNALLAEAYKQDQANQKAIAAENAAATKAGYAYEAQLAKETAAIKIAVEKDYAALKKQLTAEVVTAEKVAQSQIIAQQEEASAIIKAMLADQTAFTEEQEAEKLLAMKTRQAQDIANEKEATAILKAMKADETAFFEEQEAQKQAASLESQQTVIASGQGSAVAIQAIDAELNRLTGTVAFTMPRAVSSMLAKIPGAAEVIGTLFPALIAVAFIEILDRVGNKLYEITGDWEGFGKAAREAWDEAEKGTIDATNYLLEYQKKLQAINQVGLSGSDLAARTGANLQDDIDRTQAALAAQKAVKDAAASQKEFLSKLPTALTLPGAQSFSNTPAIALGAALGSDTAKRLQGILQTAQDIPDAIAKTAEEFKAASAEVDKLQKQLTDMRLQQLTASAQNTADVSKEADKQLEIEQRSAKQITDFQLAQDDKQDASFSDLTNSREKKLTDQFDIFYKETKDGYDKLIALDVAASFREGDAQVQALMAAMDAANKTKELWVKVGEVQAQAANGGADKFSIQLARIQADADKTFDHLWQLYGKDENNWTALAQAKEAIDEVAMQKKRQVLNQEAALIQSFFDRDILAAHNFGEAVSNILDDLAKYFEKVVFQMIVMWINGQQAMINSSRSSGGLGGILGIFAGIVGALIPGGGVPTASAGELGDLGLITPPGAALSVPGLAGGGDFSGMALVGENGPEILSGKGSITPLSKVGGTTINNYIDARGADIGVVQRLKAALEVTQRNSIAGAMINTRELALRSPKS